MVSGHPSLLPHVHACSLFLARLAPTKSQGKKGAKWKCPTVQDGKRNGYLEAQLWAGSRVLYVV